MFKIERALRIPSATITARGKRCCARCGKRIREEYVVLGFLSRGRFAHFHERCLFFTRTDDTVPHRSRGGKQP